MADPTAGLTGTNRDAAVALVNLFKQYGLESLAPKIVEFIQNGYSADTIAIQLQDTAEYKQRFSGNADRVKKGLPALSPAEYISTEQSYRQLMASADLPIGFYDSHEDFTSWIANDVSPTEAKARIDDAKALIYDLPEQSRNLFNQWYTNGDMVAYLLDASKAQPLIEQRFRAAQAAGIGQSQGVDITQGTAEQLGQLGVSADQARQGFGFIGQEQGNAGLLSQIYGGPPLTADDLAKEVFTSDVQATEKRRLLASQQRASFGGASAQGKGTLSQDSGQF